MLHLIVASEVEPCSLGCINVPGSSQGNALWGPARSTAATARNCSVDDVTVVGLQYIDGHRVLPAEADRQPVSQLAVNDPIIVVKLSGQEPPGVHGLRTKVAALEAWKRTTSTQLEEVKAVVRRLQLENAEYHKILIRILLDLFRSKYLQRLNRTLDDEEKQQWNATVDNMNDDDLKEMGVTRQQAALSKYGEYTAQGQGSRAAHHADAVPVAYAVASSTKPGMRAIYRYVYGQGTDEAIEAAEAEQA